MTCGVVVRRCSDGKVVVKGTSTAVINKTVTQKATVVERGPRGPRGLPGRDAEGSTIERTALDPIGGHVIVRSLTATLVERADSQYPLHGDDTLEIGRAHV